MQPGTTPIAELTVLLRRWSGGDDDAGEQLAPIVYAELRRLARSRLRREGPNSTLQTVELVNEAWMRLVGSAQIDWNDRNHFYALSSSIMRRVLVDRARARLRARRGGGAMVVALDDAVLNQVGTSFELVSLDDALNTLAKLDAEQAKVVELRFFAGLSIEETADALGLSVASVNRYWVTARAWLAREMTRTV